MYKNNIFVSFNKIKKISEIQQNQIIDTQDLNKLYDPECLQEYDQQSYTFQLKDLICNEQELNEIMNTYYGDDFEDFSIYKKTVKEFSSKQKKVFTYYVEIEDKEMGEMLMFLNDEIINPEDPEDKQVKFNCKFLPDKRQKYGKKTYINRNMQQSSLTSNMRGSNMNELEKIANEQEQHEIHDVDRNRIIPKRGEFAGTINTNQNNFQSRGNQQKEQGLSSGFTRGSAVPTQQPEQKQHKKDQNEIVEPTRIVRGGALNQQPQQQIRTYKKHNNNTNEKTATITFSRGNQLN